MEYICSASHAENSMIKKFISKTADVLKSIKGDPDYVARGLAIGVFIGITPTMPFQTTLALALAALCRGSKPAAVLGIWSGNPVTMPLLYAGSYKLGMLILGKPAAAFSLQQQSLMEFFKSGADTCCATIAGGALLGILPALAAYYMTRTIISRLHLHNQQATPS
jgi:uncharacterized protein (DUF2062 family)